MSIHQKSVAKPKQFSKRRESTMRHIFMVELYMVLLLELIWVYRIRSLRKKEHFIKQLDGLITGWRIEILVIVEFFDIDKEIVITEYDFVHR